ncbi:MAG: peptidoglycan editing factor PgeF [Desulfotomaculaceae bacterium]|nr:peptidoglycan editing factor PgeF [Desulfotomaculaceae bacterium]
MKEKLANMSSFIAVVRNRLKIYISPVIESTGLVIHGFTTRGGGTSAGPYSSLNTAFNVGDEHDCVRKNRILICRALGLEADKIVAGKQVHGDRVQVVDNQDQGRGAWAFEDALPDVDALVTDVPGLPLSSYYADCVPIFLFDPAHRVVALAHAGWRGTVARIGLKTLQKMSAIFRTDPKDCLAGIGPSIGPCCYEINQEVLDQIKCSFSYWTDLVVPVYPGKWLLDLWQANYRTLVDAGLLENKIDKASICTSCRNNLFFSYRAQGGTTGRMASLIMLK